MPRRGPGEVLVAMRACGICGSDLMQWYQDPRAPHVLGHEPVGIVLESDDGLPAPGARVFVHHHVPCGECDYCTRGHETLCATFKATRIDPGGFAEFIRVPAANAALDLLELPDTRQRRGRHADRAAGLLRQRARPRAGSTRTRACWSSAAARWACCSRRRRSPAART